MESYSPNLTKFWNPPRTCPLTNRVGGGGSSISHSSPFDSNALITEYNETGLDTPPEVFGDEYSDGAEAEGEGQNDDGEDVQGERRRNKIIAGAARSKVSRSSELDSGTNRLRFASCWLYATVLGHSAVVWCLFSRL